MTEKTFKDIYKDKVVKSMMEEFAYSNVMQVPKLLKITLNMGVGAAVADKKVLTHAVGDMEKIAGQKPIITMTRKSIAGFKIRAGWPIGCKVTLRGQKMYDFIERFIYINLPRTRDFHGLSESSFDGSGNYSFGVREQIVFSEIDYNTIDRIRGLDVCISTSAKTDKEALALLKAFGFPFRQKGKMYA